MDPKVTALGAVGAGVGALQTPILREFVDRKYPTTNIPSLGGFGYVSSLAGIIGGGTGLAIGAVGMSKGKDGRQRLADSYIEPAIDYGITALLTGIFSGLYPAVTEADCIAKGGYFYDGVCHKTPAATLSMQPGIQAAGSYTYKPPAIASQSYIPANTQGVDMNVLKQMSAEVQRLSQAVQALSQENAALRSQAMAPAIEVGQVIPGPVRSKQRQYGFMEGVETGAQPVKQVERIRKKFDFMG